MFSTIRSGGVQILIALVAFMFAAAPLNAALAKDIVVPIDEARLVHMDRPGAEVIVGNPSIADVAVQNARTLVVTGKTFGITNVIVIDAQGREVLNQKVRVQTDQRRLVRIYKGKGRSSYDCTPRCETALIPGDHGDHFEALAKEIRNKFGIAQSALDGEPGGQ